LFLKLLMPMAHPSTKPSLRSNLEPAQQSGACAATWGLRSNMGPAQQMGAARQTEALPFTPQGLLCALSSSSAEPAPAPSQTSLSGPFDAGETPKV
jgi:hypothetical protein